MQNRTRVTCMQMSLLCDVYTKYTIRYLTRRESEERGTKLLHAATLPPLVGT